MPIKVTAKQSDVAMILNHQRAVSLRLQIATGIQQNLCLCGMSCTTYMHYNAHA